MQKPKRKNTPYQTPRTTLFLTGAMLMILALLLCAITFSAVGESSLSTAEMTATASTIVYEGE